MGREKNDNLALINSVDWKDCNKVSQNGANRIYEPKPFQN